MFDMDVVCVKTAFDFISKLCLKYERLVLFTRCQIQPSKSALGFIQEGSHEEQSFFGNIFKKRRKWSFDFLFAIKFCSPVIIWYINLHKI